MDNIRNQVNQIIKGAIVSYQNGEITLNELNQVLNTLSYLAQAPQN